MHAWPSLVLADAPPRSADVVVIGGGIVGAATARSGARQATLKRAWMSSRAWR